MQAGLLFACVAVFSSVTLLGGWAAWFVMARQAPERRRLRQAEKLTTAGVLVENDALSPEDTPFAKGMSKAVKRSKTETKRLRKKLIRAGHDSSTAAAVYTASQIVFPIVLGVVPLFVAPSPQKWALMLFAAGAATQVSPAILRSMIKKRQQVIQNGLPDALDLLIVCLEAGSAIDQAIVKVSDELALAYPPLAEELRLVITETRAGKSRTDAFRGFAERTGVEDVRALVAMLVQTDRFGVSISKALRTHADSSRTKRRQRAEERAAKIGVKLVFPLVLFLFPAFFVVVIGPAIVGFIKVFSAR